ncbi:MAG: sigW 5 [Verrucomicrobia bacterium]|nr:sigW 5 [Verrucomicrobiota bacterium]
MKPNHKPSGGTIAPLGAPLSFRANSDASRDRMLVARIKDGDDSAFAEIVTHYRARVYAIAHRQMGNHHDAEEATQDAFVSALRGLVGFRGHSSFATWLFTITTNLTRNRYWYWWRRKRHQMVSLDAPVGFEGTITFNDVIPAEDDSPYAAAVSQDFLEQIATGMKGLSPHLRETLELKTVQDLSYEEIAKTLNLSLGTVKSRISRAREQLRAQALIATPDGLEAGESSELPHCGFQS